MKFWINCNQNYEYFGYIYKKGESQLN